MTSNTNSFDTGTVLTVITGDVFDVKIRDIIWLCRDVAQRTLHICAGKSRMKEMIACICRTYDRDTMRAITVQVFYTYVRCVYNKICQRADKPDCS